jgi:AcrR family transcriptional regulator
MKTVSSRKPVTVQPRGPVFVQNVLEAALTHLADVGFERFSIPRVAELAGVNKTSVYRRWPGNTELIQEALRSVVSQGDEPTNTGTLRGDLVALAKTVAVFMQSHRGTAVIRILLTEGANPDMRALGEMTYRNVASQAPGKVIQRAVERGELARDADPSLLLFALAGAILHRVFVERREASDAFVGQIVDLVLDGALAKN